MPNVRLVDGTEVDSCDQAWRAECEAREILKWPRLQQRQFLEAIDAPSKRGIGASNKVKAMMFAVEPDFVLRLGSREARRAYLTAVENEIGFNTRKHLEERIVELHESRKVKTCVEAE